MTSIHEFNVTEDYIFEDESRPSIPTIQIKQNKLSTDKGKVKHADADYFNIRERAQTQGTRTHKLRLINLPQLKDCPKLRKLTSVISKEEPQSGWVCFQRLKDLDSYIILKDMRKGFKEKHISKSQGINEDDDDFFILEDDRVD